MQIKFKISKTFSVTAKKYFVIGGRTANGRVKQGMNILIENKKIPIESIEIIDGVPIAMLGLVIKYKDEQEKQQLEQLLNKVKEINIE
ncbi:MAG: hypothetical protein WC223_11805 [Bacteroidales bacterium]|jgi:hypothetical protein